MANTTRPNVLLVFSDQQRWDTLGVNGSPMQLTPNLDRLAREGTCFLLPVTNQPVCAPARACLLTGKYATTHGVWKNGVGDLVGQETLAISLAAEGYSTGYVGKWHLQPSGTNPGFVEERYRGGFADFWEASNVLEFTSQPFETVMFDHKGKEVRPPGYRVDACTDRTIAALRQHAAAGRPFFQMVSFLEPHHQNDVDRYVPPVGYEERYQNPYAPPDLRPLPGNWQQQLPGYYGCIKSLDENVGRLLAALEELGQLENTIVVYTADHGCHFRTRNLEYKRSCHDASLRIPLVVWGPGFTNRQVVPEPVGLVDLMPSLLDACGVAIPEGVQGRSFLPLAQRREEGVRAWQEEVLVQISEAGTGRALRSERWTYCAMAPAGHGSTHAGGVYGARVGSAATPGSDRYAETHLYDNYADPYQHVNLLGRQQYREVAAQLRARLVERMAAIGEPAPQVQEFYGQTPA
jgi:arylsulfatase A-like enzyme